MRDRRGSPASRLWDVDQYRDIATLRESGFHQSDWDGAGPDVVWTDAVLRETRGQAVATFETW